jgi:hypothetical protein
MLPFFRTGIQPARQQGINALTRQKIIKRNTTAALSQCMRARLSYPAITLAVLSAFNPAMAFAQEVDIDAPLLKTVFIDPSSINSSLSTQTVDVTLIFEDESTITSTPIFLENVTTNEQLSLIQVGTWSTQGLNHTGEFRANFTSSEAEGLWAISGLVATDSQGNSNSEYDTANELIFARFQPFVSHAVDASQTDFDAQVQASATFSQTGQAQTSVMNITLEDAKEYEIWFVPNSGTTITNIALSNSISLAEDCNISTDFAKCTVTASNNNTAITATIDTTSAVNTSFGYSAFVQPTAAGSEANWLNNYAEFPIADADLDGTPNEQDLDDDGDNVPDIEDLFPLDSSESTDLDNDGVGDNADLDDDNDGVPDLQDTFPEDPFETGDNDGDGLGNNADNDDDNDGVLDSSDAFPFDATESADFDADGIGDNADDDDDNDGGTDDNDAFPFDASETIDSDGDGVGNNADTDDDNDGTLDVNDAFPRDPTEITDTDEDGIGNNADDDDDNDGVLDNVDLFPLDPGDSRDNDQDGVGDNLDLDDDNDGVVDLDDEFPFNDSESVDSDGDGIGNNADPDDDNDGLDDIYDRFPLDASEVADFDGDNIGDNADNDDDNDGVLDDVDAFRFAVTEWFDTDNDGIGNNADNDDDNDGLNDQFDAFPLDATETMDNDGDNIGDNADNDDDNDGVVDANDAFPLDETETTDTDRDGIGNNTDTDDDGDGVVDENDLFPLDRTESADNDLDGVGNNADNDDDNDNVLDAVDVFPFDATETLDNDQDGVGDNADTDDDNDNFPDEEDLFPFDASEWADNDLDNIGDNRDFDDDNDGVLDSLDAFPFDDSETLDNDQDGVGNNSDDDDDNDGTLDAVDAFPFSAAEQVDSDLDGIGNNADADDDNDGIVDENDSEPLNPTIGDEQAPSIDGLENFTIEATGMLTEVILDAPRVSDDNLNPASLSNDYEGPLPVGDNLITWTAIDFAGNTTEEVQTVTVVDTTPPEFTEIDTVSIAARGFLTDVSSDLVITADDIVDGSVQAVLVTENNLRAGLQSVIMSATDTAGNTSMTEIFVDIEPSIVVKPIGVAGPGNRLNIPVSLTGKASNYPVTVDYEIIGPVTSQQSGTLSITQGQQGTLAVDVSATANLGQQIYITFTNGVNANSALTSEVVIDIDTTNLQPLSTIQAQQADDNDNLQTVAVVYRDQGLVTLVADINDINISDSHVLNWQIKAPDSGSDDNSAASFIAPSDLDLDTSANTFEFSPTSIPVGIYSVALNVRESDTIEAYSVNLEYALVVQDSLPALSSTADSDFDGISDADEGQFDSDADGIPDYLDDNDNIANLPSGVSEQPLTTLAGYRLTLGDVARVAKQEIAASTNIRLQDLADFGGENNSSIDDAEDIHFTAVQSLQNFNIEGLDFAGQSLPVVIPLATGTRIPENAVYRKYNSDDGWFTFVENQNNSIASASYDADGNCPLATSDSYTSGLSTGDTCIRLTIQDGGPNDADLLANGIIKDPGVLTVQLPNRSPLINVARQTTVTEGELIRVDASLTTDAEGDALTFRWTQIGGIPIALDENTSPLLSFNAPQIDGNESLLFRLDVFDGRATSTVNVTVTIRNINTAPEVSINAHNATADENTTVSISAQVSDADSDIVTVRWEQLSGPAVTLVGADTANVSFNAPSVSSTETVELRVIVSDSAKEVAATTRVSILNVEPVTVSPPSSGSGDDSGGGSMSLMMLMLGLLVALVRRSKTFSPNHSLIKLKSNGVKNDSQVVLTRYKQSVPIMPAGLSVKHYFRGRVLCHMQKSINRLSTHRSLFGAIKPSS